MRIRRLARLSAVALVVCLAGSATRAAPGDFSAVPLLPASRGNVAQGINNAGQVAGYDYGFSVANRAYRFTPGPGGGIVEELPNFGHTINFGWALNDAGQVVGSSSVDGDNNAHAFRYTGSPGSPGVLEDLGVLPGHVASRAAAINNLGQVVGASIPRSNVENEHAFRYTGAAGAAGMLEDLGVLPGAISSAASGINDAGQVVGSSRFTQSRGGAFLYTGAPGAGGVMHDLGTLRGIGGSGANAINNAGVIVGSSSVSDTVSHAFRYTGTPGAGGTMTDLGSLGGDATGSIAYAINEAGVIAGTSARTPLPQDFDAVLWLPDASNTLINLDAWLNANHPADGARWHLANAWGINDQGLITGGGSYDDGSGPRIAGWVLDASGLLPEPGTASLFCVATAAALLRRRLPNRT